MNRNKTNAQAIEEVAKRTVVTEFDGTQLTLFHLDHLAPEDLSSEEDKAPRQIVDWSCGTPIWEKLPAAISQPNIEEPYEEPGY